MPQPQRQPLTPPLSALPLLGLSLYAALSRLTHGTYTPTFHAYQTARAPDDGSLGSRLIPVMDLTIAVAVAVGGRKVRMGAAGVLGVGTVGSMVAMRSFGEGFDWGVLLICGVAGLGALWDAREREKRG